LSATFRLLFLSRDPQDDVAVAFARPAHGPEPIDPDLVQPDDALAAAAKLREKADEFTRASRTVSFSRPL
jgi:hypothetical protein